MITRSPRVGASKLSGGTVTRYAFGSLGTGGFATLPGLVLIYYLTDTLGVAAGAAGAIIMVAKIWDVIIDPVIGSLSDRALAKTGSRRAPMLVGAVGLPIAFTLTFAVPSDTAPATATLWVLLAFTTAATCFSLFQVPYIALPAELTSGYSERTRLLTWRVVVLTAAILLFGAGGPEIRALFPSNPATGYLVMAAVAGCVLGLGMWIAATVAPRSRGQNHLARTPLLSLSHYRDGFRVLRESQPFRALLATFMLQAVATGLMLAGAQFVATWVLEDEKAVTPLFIALIAPALLVAPVWQVAANRLGKEATFKIASALFLVATLSLTAMVWVPGWWVIAPVGLAGAAYAGMQTLPMAMLPDVISHSDALSGVPGRAGVFGGVWTAGETVGMALGSAVLTAVLTLSGYIESTAGNTVAQPDSAITAITLAFSLLPAVFILASLVTLHRYRLRESDIAALGGLGAREEQS